MSRNSRSVIRNVWRRDGERYNPKNTVKTVKHDMKVMVWGCFCYNGVGRLYRINGIMRKEHYHNILRNQMIPSARGLFFDNDFIFSMITTQSIQQSWFVNTWGTKESMSWTGLLNRQIWIPKRICGISWIVAKSMQSCHRSQSVWYQILVAQQYVLNSCLWRVCDPMTWA